MQSEKRYDSTGSAINFVFDRVQSFLDEHIALPKKIVAAPELGTAMSADHHFCFCGHRIPMHIDYELAGGELVLHAA